MTDTYKYLMMFLSDKEYSFKPHDKDLVYVTLLHGEKNFTWGLFINDFTQNDLFKFVFAYGKFCGKNGIGVDNDI